jgi:hypothetical protein
MNKNTCLCNNLVTKQQPYQLTIQQLASGENTQHTVFPFVSLLLLVYKYLWFVGSLISSAASWSLWLDFKLFENVDCLKILEPWEGEVIKEACGWSSVTRMESSRAWSQREQRAQIPLGLRVKMRIWYLTLPQKQVNTTFCPWEAALGLCGSKWSP